MQLEDGRRIPVPGHIEDNASDDPSLFFFQWSAVQHFQRAVSHIKNLYFGGAQLF